MTLRTLQNAIDGYEQRQERAERAAWERTRWLAAAILTPYAAKGKTIKPTDLARFPWDQKEGPKRKPLTPEQIAWRKRMDEKMKQLHSGGTEGS